MENDDWSSHDSWLTALRNQDLQHPDCSYLILPDDQRFLSGSSRLESCCRRETLYFLFLASTFFSIVALVADVSVVLTPQIPSAAERASFFVSMAAVSTGRLVQVLNPLSSLQGTPCCCCLGGGDENTFKRMLLRIIYTDCRSLKVGVKACVFSGSCLDSLLSGMVEPSHPWRCFLVMPTHR